MATDVMSRNTVPPKDIIKIITDKPVSVMPSLVSLLIPCTGMNEYTQMCVASILKHTRMPYEMIFIDIGSLDGTEDYLTGLKQGLNQVRVEIVRTPTDLGIPAACRDAIDRCRGEYVVFLNNDIIVTAGWINKMIGLMESSTSLGMVGPMSNFTIHPQLVETVPYRSGRRKQLRAGDEASGSHGLIDLDALNAFAEEMHKENQGKWLRAERLGPFCLMIRRELIKKFDKQGTFGKYDLTLFDTDILSARVRQLGYNLAVCRDLFIHHFGVRTFAHGAPATTATTGTAGGVPNTENPS